MNKNALRNVTLLTSASVVLAFATYIANLWLFSSHRHFSPADASFSEGIVLIILGVLFLLGSGGITHGSQKAAILASVADALGKEVIGPSEIFRRDAWKPKGYTRLGLILIIAE